MEVIYDSINDSIKNEPAEIDIVAIHGLNFRGAQNHSQSTWGKNGVLWLRDLLPQALSKAVRVLLFSYNSSPVFEGGALDVDDYAVLLLQWLVNYRKGNAVSRPLIFVCHSLGGIVAKSALVEARLNPQYELIAQATRVLVFFATPHQGGNHADFGGVVAAIVRLGMRRPKNDLINALKNSSNAAHKRFEQSRHIFEHYLAVSFFESEPYGNLGIIVDKSSATLNLPGSIETPIGLPADHSSICRFDSTWPSCALVLDTISDVIEKALRRTAESQHCLIPQSTSRHEHWLIPRCPNSLFTGRAAIIKRIADAVTASKSGSQRRFILTGLGGQGKSEICLQVASQVRYHFWGVFWVDVSNETIAKEDLSKISQLLGPYNLSCIPADQDWLLILDNADDPNYDYATYFPSGNHGSVIMTSRNPQCGRVYQTVGWEDIGNLNRNDSVELLLKALGSPPPHNPQSEQYYEATIVVEAVGFHTLATIQAGAYISGGYCTLVEYPSLLRQNTRRLMEFHEIQQQPRYHNAYATLEVSIQILENCGRTEGESEKSNDALELLHLLSALHNEDMPLDVLQAAWKGARKVLSQPNPEDESILYMNIWHGSMLPEFLRSSQADIWDPFRQYQAVNRLKSLALIRGDSVTNKATISMHPLAHTWAKARQTPEQRKRAVWTALCVVALAKYEAKGEWRPWKARFSSHLLPLVQAGCLFTGHEAQSEHILQACHQIAWLFDDLHLEQDGEQFLKELFNCLRVKAHEPQADLLPLHRVFACFISIQGRTKDGVQILEKTVETFNTMSTSDPGERFWSLYDLAVAYRRDKQTTKAIAIMQKVLQEDYFSQLAEYSRLNAKQELGSAYLDGSQSNKATELLEQVVSMGDQFTDTDQNRLRWQHELGRAYLAENRTPEAIKVLEHVVQIQDTTLDETNPARLASQLELAVAYRRAGEDAKAVELLQRVVSATLNESHPGRLESQRTLALAYLKSGQLPPNHPPEQ